MSILINGMDMPKCGEKIIVLTSSGYVEDVSGQVIQGVEAIPVPPHGALMDRDDFFATCPELVDGYKHITDDLVVIPAVEGE